MKTYYREADGYTYWLDDKGAVIGAPTWEDGSFDTSLSGEANYIADFILDENGDGPTQEEQKAAIEAEVRAALAV